jgi:predicted helicase
MHLSDTGQCFPLYWYERVDEMENQPQAEMFADAAKPDAEGYIRRDAISDWALGEYRCRYADQTITKVDIFWYVYGILHAPEYKDRFASDLKKMVPRVPFAADFRAFSSAGRELGHWHLGYETADPYPLEEEFKRLVMEDADYRVHKMVFGKRDGGKDKSVIVYNQNITLKGIPIETYGYLVNGKSALEWVMERYTVTIHKESGIKNDPNDWSKEPRYILDLVKRIVRVSLETVRIVESLPPLNEQE